MHRLQGILDRIEGQGFKAYKQLAGRYRFDDFTLSIDHVQGDPFAQPSRISVRLNSAQHGLSADLWSTRTRQTAVEDFLARALTQGIARYVKGRRGTGKSGQIVIVTSGQQILRRNALLIEGTEIEARLLLALPADGRSVRIADAREMLFVELPRLVAAGLVYLERDLSSLMRQIEQLEDQQFMRNWLAEVGAVAFVGDGSLLPRASGVDDRPLAAGLPFKAPDSMSCRVHLPHAGEMSGLLIPEGVTLIVGGGFHGKSTLLQALERGVYDHLPGDGRELVVTTETAVKIRAEDHRAIREVNISPFIGTLPSNRSTVAFSTENASGSTSQAANIIEALECGANCLLIDEDTSATNFMIRDRRMQQLVSAELEPIIPLLQRVRELYEKRGVSSIIVTGGSGDYLAVADRVIMMDNYCARDISEKARRLAGERPPLPPDAASLSMMRPRNYAPEIFDARRADGKEQIVARTGQLLEYGRQRIDLSRVEQLLDEGQLETIGLLLAYAARNHQDHPAGLIGALRQALHEVEEQGLDILTSWKVGHLALPRLYELAAAANRLRGVTSAGPRC